MLCQKLLRPKPTSTSRFVSRLRSGWNTSPAPHFFSTEESLQLPNEDGTKLNPKSSSSSSSSSVVVDWNTPDVDKVELTKAVLRRYGFSDTHLSKLHSIHPHLFTDYHPEKILLPKLEFYRCTVGFSNTDLPRSICSNPALLTYSLHNQIIPVYNFIKALLLSDNPDDDEIVLKTVKQSGSRLLGYSLEKRIAPGISALTQAGLPHRHILHLLRIDPTVLGSLSLGKSIQRAADMGFNPNKLSFVEALRIFTGLSKSTWDKKMEAYRKCGLSDEEILMAFKSYPKFMSLSEEKIEKTMDFVVNKMGCQPAYLARNPALLTYSLDKRTIPRFTLVKHLQAKGLLPRKNISLAVLLQMKEKDFIDKYVNRYEIDVPGLMGIYLGKISPQEAIL